MTLQGWRYHVVGGDTAIEKMMEDACAISSGLKEANIIIFSGGTDVSPTMYGEHVLHALTEFPDRERDRVEAAIYMAAVAKKKHVFGICRGAQLLNVLNGGKLWQHVDKHVRTQHPCVYVNEKGEKYIVNVTSDHHQMMIPSASGKVIGYCGLSTIKSTGAEDFPQSGEQGRDPEIVWYKDTRTLCFQPHPEWGSISCASLFFDCVKRVMIG